MRLLILAALLPAAASALLPAPGGVYPLRPGLYVARGEACGSPPNAAILEYDRRGLNGAHSRACVARVLSRRGGWFDVRQSCIGAGTGPAPRTSIRQSIQVHGAEGFTIGRRGRGGTTYAYCRPDEVPASLRRRAGGATRERPFPA